MVFTEQKLQNYLERFGYQPIEVPTLEPASLFLTKAGDQIIERLVTFDHRGHLFALRPEFTASAAYRYLMEERRDVVRWQCSGPIFENRMQGEAPSGYPFQRYSLGAELIGFPGIFADAEIVALAILGLTEQGLKDYRLMLGHVGLTQHLMRRFRLDDRALRFLLKQRVDLYEGSITRDEIIEKLNRYLAVENRTADVTSDADRLESSAAMTTEMLSSVLSSSRRSQTLGGRSQQDIARRLLEKEQRAASRAQIIAALDFLIDWMAIRGPLESTYTQISAYLSADDDIGHHMLEQWSQMISMLGQYGIREDMIDLQPDLVRSWDYYNGMVFEVVTRKGDLLAGGGRYDDLAQLLGAPSPVPAVGFVYEMDAVTAALGENTRAFPGVSITGPDSNTINWSQALRAAGIPVSVLPESTDVREGTVHINAANQAQYATQTFEITQIPQLVDQLKRDIITGAQ